MKKRLLCLLIAALVLPSAFLLTAHAEEPLYSEKFKETEENVLVGYYGDKLQWWLNTQDKTCGIICGGVAENIDSLRKYSNGLSTMFFGSDVTVIGEGAFIGFENTKIRLNSAISEIRNNAFKDCKNLEVIDIIDGLKTIGDGAFESCTSIKTLVLPTSLEYIGKGAFKNCTDLREVHIYSKNIVIDEGAFEGCDDLKIVNFYGENLDIRNNNDNVKKLTEKSWLDIAAPCAVGVVISATIVAVYIFCRKKSLADKEEFEK